MSNTIISFKNRLTDEAVPLIEYFKRISNNKILIPEIVSILRDLNFDNDLRSLIQNSVSPKLIRKIFQQEFDVKSRDSRAILKILLSETKDKDASTLIRNTSTQELKESISNECKTNTKEVVVETTISKTTPSPPRDIKKEYVSKPNIAREQKSKETKDLDIDSFREMDKEFIVEYMHKNLKKKMTFCIKAASLIIEKRFIPKSFEEIENTSDSELLFISMNSTTEDVVAYVQNEGKEIDSHLEFTYMEIEKRFPDKFSHDSKLKLADRIDGSDMEIEELEFLDDESIKDI
jgi:hypothetical protein